MSKRGSKAAAKPQDEAITLAIQESERLHDLAMEQGIMSKTRRIAGTTLPATSALLKADGKDIVKRSSMRRSRYLLVFNCQLAPAAAGRLGTLARLDTRNPVMYIDFPEGRLRLHGTLTFPRNKYVVLRMGNKEVLCEDVLESIIVFSEAHWVGTAEENPEEIPLPIPDSLKMEQRHPNVDFAARAGGAGGAIGAGSQEVEDVEDEVEDALPASQAAAGGNRRVSRHAQAKKRTRYAEDSDASFGDDESDEEKELVMKLPRKKPASAARRRSGSASQPESQPQSEPQSQRIMIDLAATDSDEDEPLVTRAIKKPAAVKRSAPSSAKKPLPKKSAKPVTAAAAAKKNKNNNASEDEDGLVDLVDSSSEEENDEEEGDALPASQRPRRAAAGEASKKLKVSSGTDDSEGSSSSEDDASSGEEEDGSDGSQEAEASEGEDGGSQSEDEYAPSE